MKTLKLSAVLLASVGLAACTSMSDAGQVREAGLEAVNQPVIARQDVALDLPVSADGLGQSGMKTLDSWFRSLELAYGDRIYVDGAAAGLAREDVAAVTADYGLVIEDSAPITPGMIDPGTVRVVVTRTRATVPDCPNWSKPAQPTWQNVQTPGYGCAVNGNMAAIIANPEDLVIGRRPSNEVSAAATRSIAVHVGGK